MTHEYKDFTFNQYQQMRCTSYTGGASWLRSNTEKAFYVVACSPMEISEYFSQHPTDTVRGQFIPFDCAFSVDSPTLAGK
jgi:hypothetical protein